MDSLTQVALGAAVGEAVLGRKIGWRAPLWGGICGTLPDLDVLIAFDDPVADFTYHRSFSHSLFMLTLLTPLLVWLILRIHPHTRAYRRGWFWLVWLALLTHSLLDCFTVYGTQIFWPFITTPQTWSTIFIIDPLYTLPLLVGVLAALFARRTRRLGHRLNTLGLVLSSVYLAWSLGAKLYVEQLARDSLARQHIDYRQLLLTPAPFNTVLWRVLAMNETGYYEGFYSLLDHHTDISLERYPSASQLLGGLAGHWPVRRLQWFTKGFYSVSRERDAVVMTDLRMGLEPDYVFRFIVAKVSNPHPLPIPSERLTTNRSWQRLPEIWRRIWNEPRAVKAHLEPNR